MLTDNNRSGRTRVRRHPERGQYDRDTIYAIIDEAYLAHVGIVEEGRPVVIPMLHARVDDTLYLHGSTASRLLKTLASGAECCLTFTLLDGLVLARSAMHHSMNYRSAVIFGSGRVVTGADEKWRVFEALVEQVIPGRWSEIRQPDEQETKATMVVAIAIRDASAKVRSGGVRENRIPGDESTWAGVVPIELQVSAPIPDPSNGAMLDVPVSVSRMASARS